MPIANINGVDLNYEVASQGEAVVFLHGMTGSTQDWANQIAGLSPKYRIVAMDQRGHGKSAAPSKPEEYYVQVLVDDVIELLKMLDIKKFCLVGHSLSGRVALQSALDHQDMLAALVLVGTSSGLRARDSEYAKLRRKVVELARSQGMEAAFEYDAANNPMRIERFKKYPEQREVARQKMLRTSVDAYNYIGGGWEPVTPRLSEIKVPTLICRGDEDVMTAESIQVLKEGIAGSELITFKGAGHSPHEDTPDAFNEALLKFLNRIKW